MKRWDTTCVPKYFKVLLRTLKLPESYFRFLLTAPCFCMWIRRMAGDSCKYSITSWMCAPETQCPPHPQHATPGLRTDSSHFGHAQEFFSTDCGGCFNMHTLQYLGQDWGHRRRSMKNVLFPLLLFPKVLKKIKTNKQKTKLKMGSGREYQGLYL